MDQTIDVRDLQTAPDPEPGRIPAIIGLLVCRVVVPLWLLTGALFKLSELDWKLLPPPVRATSEWVGSALGRDPELWLGASMRFLIGTEFLLVGLMFASTRLARPLAAATMSLFVVILVIVLAQGYDPEKGLASLVGGDCGCFGSAGPPASVMLLIDAILLGCVLLLRPRYRGSDRVGYLLGAFLVSAAVGYGVAFGVPERTIANVASPESGALKSNYYPRFEEWVGKPLADQELAQLLPRPFPADLEQGETLLVLYRGDCDHCQEMFLTYFSDPVLPVPTVAVDVMDYDPAGLLEFYCDGCLRAELPAGPSYLIQTPVVVRVSDGVVTCVTDGSNSDEEAERCIFGLGLE